MGESWPVLVMDVLRRHRLGKDSAAIAAKLQKDVRMIETIIDAERWRQSSGGCVVAPQPSGDGGPLPTWAYRLPPNLTVLVGGKAP